MRVFLGLLLLLGIFGLAGVAQHRFSAKARVERDQAFAARRAPEEGIYRTTGRAILRIGRPSGADPIELPEPGLPSSGERGTSPTAHKSPRPVGGDSFPPTDWTPPVYEMTVQSGQVLSRICQEFYGTGKPPIPQLVATYNGLGDPDSVRAGQKLLLPPLEVLRASQP